MAWPPAADRQAGDQLPLLGRHWPEYVAYAVSFLTIGIMWLNHHKMLSQVTKVDLTTLMLNTFR